MIILYQTSTQPKTCESNDSEREKKVLPKDRLKYNSQEIYTLAMSKSLQTLTECSELT